MQRQPSCLSLFISCAALWCCVAGGVQAQAPDWQVDPAAYEATMSVVAVVADVKAQGSGDRLAAFSGEVVRGVAAPVAVGMQHLYFLTVYGNGSGGTLSLQYYHAASGTVRPIPETLTFQTNGVIGSVTTPFTVHPAPITGQDPPPAPALVTPADGASGLGTSVRFVWRRAATAEYYTLQLATDAAFGAIIVAPTVLTDTTLVVEGLDVNTTYHWRVRGENAGGAGPWSGAYRLTTVLPAPGAPLLLSPEADAADVPTAPTLRWHAMPGAASYTLQVDEDSDFQTPLIFAPSLLDTAYVAAGLAHGTAYVWRVRAENAGGVGAWSQPRHFTTVAPPPGAPVLRLPQDGTEAPATEVTLQWDAAAGATHYEVEVATDAAFTATVLHAEGLPEAQYVAAGLLRGTTYHWRVRAVGAGGTGAWSDAFHFRVQASSVGAEAEGAAYRFALDGAAPNPFREATTLHFTLDRPGPVTLCVYDAAGREVGRPLAAWQAPGPHTIRYDGRHLPPGVYFIRLQAGGATQTRAVVRAE